MSKPTVNVFIRQVYGRATLYPANDQARLFCELLGAKTLTNAQLARIERLGFTIETVADQAAIEEAFGLV